MGMHTREQHTAPSAYLVLWDLPEGMQHEVFCLLSSADKAALRATCHATRVLVDRYLKQASFVGAPNAQATHLPSSIQHVAMHTSGPARPTWLLHSLQNVKQLRSLHVSAMSAWETMPVKEAKQRMKAQELPGLLAALPELLSRASPGGHLTQLTLMGVGCSLRRVREKDMQGMLCRLKEYDQPGYQLKEFATPLGLNVFRPTLQTLSNCLKGLTHLHMEGARWHLLPHYGTHHLSQLSNLSYLSLRGAQDLHVSHIAPLYLCTRLKSLDLCDASITEPDEGPEDPMFRWSLHSLHPSSAQVVQNMCAENGWMPPNNRVHPARVLLKQLGRIPSLTALNVQGLPLPENYDDDDMPDIRLDEMLGPLAPRLRCLDLSFTYDNIGGWTDAQFADALSQLTCLTWLRLDQFETRYSSRLLVEGLQEQVFPNLRYCELPYMTLDAESIGALAALTQVTSLLLPDPEDPDDEQVALDALNRLLDEIGANLRELDLSGWFVEPMHIATCCPNLIGLNLSNTRAEEEEEFVTFEDSFFSQLPRLTRFLCEATGFDDKAMCSILKHCPALKELSAANCCVVGESLLPAHFVIALCKATEAEEIVKKHGTVIPPGVVYQGELHTSLEILQLDRQYLGPGDEKGGRLTDKGIQVLARLLPSLQQLSINDAVLAHGGWLTLGLCCTQLTSLQVTNTFITDTDLEWLAQGEVHAAELQRHISLLPGLEYNARIKKKGNGDMLVFFPSLHDLEVTEKQDGTPYITPAGVDTLAGGVQAGRCAVRELRILQSLQDDVDDQEESDDDDDYDYDGNGHESASSYDTMSTSSAVAATLTQTTLDASTSAPPPAATNANALYDTVQSFDPPPAAIGTNAQPPSRVVSSTGQPPLQQQQPQGASARARHRQQQAALDRLIASVRPYRALPPPAGVAGAGVAQSSTESKAVGNLTTGPSCPAAAAAAAAAPPLPPPLSNAACTDAGTGTKALSPEQRQELASAQLRGGQSDLEIAADFMRGWAARVQAQNTDACAPEAQDTSVAQSSIQLGVAEQSATATTQPMSSGPQQQAAGSDAQAQGPVLEASSLSGTATGRRANQGVVASSSRADASGSGLRSVGQLLGHQMVNLEAAFQTVGSSMAGFMSSLVASVNAASAATGAPGHGEPHTETESETDSDSDSQWEEVQPGEDAEVDREAERKLALERRPRILNQASVARWLSQGLLVRNTLQMTEEEERARTWTEDPGLEFDRADPWFRFGIHANESAS